MTAGGEPCLAAQPPGKAARHRGSPGPACAGGATGPRRDCQAQSHSDVSGADKAIIYSHVCDIGQCPRPQLVAQASEPSKDTPTRCPLPLPGVSQAFWMVWGLGTSTPWCLLVYSLISEGGALRPLTLSHPSLNPVPPCSGTEQTLGTRSPMAHSCPRWDCGLESGRVLAL